MHHGKLVRDHIPDMMIAQGKAPAVEVLDERQYAEALCDKLREEVAEYVASRSLEELGDVLEVVHALAAAHGTGPAELERVRQEKRERRGGFAKRLFLKGTNAE